ncbi:MAG: hypothetical protein U0556_01925 [Dehalococcoidia bacterium]
MTIADRIAERARRSQRRRRIAWIAVLTLLSPLVGCLPVWLLMGRVQLSEMPGSVAGEVAASTSPELRFTGVSDGLRWIDLRARPEGDRPGTIRTVLIDERDPTRPVATWTVEVAGPGPIWMEMPPIAKSAGVPYLVVVETIGPDEPDTMLRLAWTTEHQPNLAVQRFYTTSPVAWLLVTAHRVWTAGILVPALLLGGAFVVLFILIGWMVAGRSAALRSALWAAAGILVLVWGVVAVQAALSAQLWSRLSPHWPDAT